MPSISSAKRPARSPAARSNPRRRRGAPPRTAADAVTVAITAQVVICIVLLAAAGVTKKMDAERYAAVKQQYDTVATDPAQADTLIEVVDQVRREGFFESLESAIDDLREKLTGGGQAAEPPPRTDEQDPPLETAPPPEQDDMGASTYTFDYQYLEVDVESALLYAPGPSPLEGKGGMYEVVAFGGNEWLPAPTGTSLAPVYFSARAKPPITGVITSAFAYRYHPITEKTDFHNGIDIAAEEGADILAALPGEVKEVGWDDIYGNYVILKHATHLETFYAHCSEVLVEEGAAVRQGDRIALVGDTGVATGNHLHFSVIVDGEYTDPYWMLKDNIQLIREE